MTGTEFGIGAVLGIIVGNVIKFFWDRWNREYVTKKECADCSTRKLADEIVIMKEVLLDVAAHIGLPVEKYKGLVK